MNPPMKFLIQPHIGKNYKTRDIVYICDNGHKPGETVEADINTCCQWMVYAKSSRVNKAETYKITSANFNHGSVDGNPCTTTKPSPSIKYLMRQPHIIKMVKSTVSQVDFIKQVSIEYGYNISSANASRLYASITDSPTSKQGLGYKLIKPWLEEFVRLNPESAYTYSEDPVTGEFQHASILFPVGSVFKHSFKGTLMLNGGFVKMKNGGIAQMFVLTLGDRLNHNLPVAIGVYPVESTVNYSDFLSLLRHNAEVWERVNDTIRGLALIHDRHLSFRSAVKASLPSHVLDRVDVIHLVRNSKV
jgi:hypothetical protein